MRRLATLLLALLCACALSAAPSAEKRLDTYLRLAREAVARMPAPPSDAPASLRPERYSLMLEQLAQQSPRAELEHVRFFVLQLSAQFPTDEKLRRAGDALVDTLAAEREAALARHRAEVEALLKKSAQACLAATSAADLDPALRELAPYRNSAEDPRQRLQRDYLAQQRAVQMFHFVSRWQDYLAARAAGEHDRARSSLFELRNSVDPALIPRSKLHALEASLPAPATARTQFAATSASQAANLDPELLFARLEKLENLEQLAPLWPELERARAAGLVHEQVPQTFGALLTAKADAEAGRIDLAAFEVENRLASFSSIPPRLAPVLERLSEERRRIALGVVFRDSGIAQRTDEPTDAYVLRVARAAAEAENWEYVLRTLEFFRAISASRTPPAWSRRELEASLAYVAGRRLAEAGQLPQAILAYQDSLAQAGSVVPVELVAKRLAAIRETNPEAFAEAARTARNYDRSTRFPPQPPMPQGMNPTYLLPRSERPFTR